MIKTTSRPQSSSKAMIRFSVLARPEHFAMLIFLPCGQHISPTRSLESSSTRRKYKTCEEDKQLESLIAADTNCVTIVAKAWDLHVDHILEVGITFHLSVRHVRSVLGRIAVMSRRFRGSMRSYSGAVEHDIAEDDGRKATCRC